MRVRTARTKKNSTKLHSQQMHEIARDSSTFAEMATQRGKWFCAHRQNLKDYTAGGLQLVANLFCGMRLASAKEKRSSIK